MVDIMMYGRYSAAVILRQFYVLIIITLEYYDLLRPTLDTLSRELSQ
jgi:hypothetical protein